MDGLGHHGIIHVMKILDNQDKLDAFQDRLGELIDAARSVHAAIDAVDIAISDALGIHRNDLRCLNLLEKGPLIASEIGKQTGLTSGSVTALIDRLEQAGFVQRGRSPLDRRIVEVSIPADAYARIDVLYRVVGGAVRERFSALEPEQLTAVIETLTSFANAYRVAMDNLPASKE